MKYLLSFPDPNQHLIHIDIPLPASPEPTRLHLPTWRPGRYEIGPYVQNLVGVRASDARGKAVPVTKLTSYHWEVAPSDVEVTFHYEYHATARDAGGSLFDEEQVYVNGVNLFLYRPDGLGEACEVVLDLPADYRIACGLRQEGHRLFAEDFHQLVDGPFIASASLQHHCFEVEGITHHLWFQGEVQPDWERLEKDFVRFGEAQHRLFAGIPCREYHYLFQIDNANRYHGVEHFNSTVIALGPGFRLMEDDLYEELLGVSCHELFHTWNVKAIRPADMQPYDYEGPNYSRLHYVTEGVTTYYGDLMLLKSGVWDLSNYLKVLNNSVLKRHYLTHGRRHVSLEAASFDSWVNGYSAGVPNRKISFYTKGALAAFILDVRIREATQNRSSLDTVMRLMYDRFGRTGKGYTREDYQSIAEEVSGISLETYFSDFVSGTIPLENALSEAGDYLGLSLAARKFAHEYHKVFGFMLKKNKVSQIFEGSPAVKAGLQIDDEVVALNGYRVDESNFNDLANYFSQAEEWRLHLFRNGKLRRLRLYPDSAYRTGYYMFSEIAQPSPAQLANRESWMRVD